MDSLAQIATTPVPTVLAIVGAVCLVLAIITPIELKEIKIIPSRSQKLQLAAFGAVLLVTSVGLHVFGLFQEQEHWPGPTPTSTSTPTSVPTQTVSPASRPTRMATHTPTPTCAVTAPTDTDTLFALIDAEAQAILSEDIELIKVIFDPGAIIRNKATDQQWGSPEVYYAEKFENEVHCRAEHYDYRITKLTDEEALVTTGNRGEWGWEADGCTTTYEHPPGADQWHFRRDALGCWRIVSFTYNIHTQ